jgi:SAM-dependent methyltransferase
MGINTITHNGKRYPAFQSTGNAARWIQPFALELCRGDGIDVGCNRKEWALESACWAIDPEITPEYSAMNLPNAPFTSLGWDFIFSSHMLEHYQGSWVDVLEYWHSKLKQGGVLFLYLPGPGQSYWKSWSNRKHVHNFTPEIFREYMDSCELWCKWFVTGEDLNNSFCVVAEKI